MANDPNKTTEKIQDVLKDIRKLENNRDKMEELVEVLESEEDLDLFHGEKYRVFCEAYIIRLLRKYIHGIENQEILLAVYGLLDGYKGIKIEERCQKYAEKAGKFDKRIKPTWKDPNGSLSHIEKKIIEKLIENLVAKIFDSENRKVPLGLAGEVNKELSSKFPDRFPKELPLPTPRYLLKEDGSSKNKKTEINIGDGNSGNTDKIIGNGTGASKKRFSKRRIRKMFAIIIVAVVLMTILVFITFNDRRNKNIEEQSVGGSDFQPPARIHYPNGMYIDINESTKIIDAEDGIIIVPIGDDGQSMETRSLSDGTNSEAIINGEDNFELKGGR